MKNAVAYIRCSKEETAINGHTLAAQEAAIRTYCSANGYSVTVVVDAGVSGGTPIDRRAGGAVMMELVRKKKVQAVIAVRLDRLFRDTIDALTITSELDRLGCAVVLLDMAGGTLDTSTPAGRMMVALMSSFAEMERATIKARVRSVLAHKASKGERVSRHPPIGYTFTSDGMVVENPEELQVVATIKNLHRNGYATSKIASILNKNKVPARGSRWHASTVASVVAAA